MAGKMVLLKAVLSAIPNHSMQCFKLPQSLCKRIQSALTQFWWDSKEGKRGMSLVAWNTMIKSKRNGGLGFRDIQSFNDAPLAKISCRILSLPSSLLARFLAGKYFHNQEFLHVKAPSACSHGWRDILIGRDLINDQLGWAIGNGESVSVWNDQWPYADRKWSPMGPAPESSKDLKVWSSLENRHENGMPKRSITCSLSFKVQSCRSNPASVEENLAEPKLGTVHC